MSRVFDYHVNHITKAERKHWDALVGFDSCKQSC